MDITFNCDKCGQHIVIDEAGVGMKLPCPKCGNELTIPSNPGWLVQINEVIRAQVQKILAGRAMVADARLAVQDVLRETGYQPKAGTDGTVEGFRSEDRRNLVIETNVAIANGYRQMREANDPDILQEYPAWRLIREIETEVQRNWKERWAKAAEGTPENGRNDSEYIARKDHPIWQRLGSLWEDSLGNPFPPFAWDSGMGVEEIDRDEAMGVGVIDARAVVASQLKEPAPQFIGIEDERITKWLRSQPKT